MKYFIITVDTEGDKLWDYKKGQEVKTENSLYIPRFQELCEKYGFKPVWLTNYEMASDNRYVEYIKPKMEQGLCEVGIHVHAWNNPPLYDLKGKYSGNPYLLEFPYEIMKAKFKTTYDLITSKFGKAPVTHRAGRWGMNDDYFKLLEEFDIKTDCSFTPTISWGKFTGETVNSGPDYTQVKRECHYIGKVFEVPMTIRTTRLAKRGSWKHKLRVLLQKESIWLRPATASLQEMLWLCDIVNKESQTDYLEFMVHSSELMPNGSPYFKDNDAIEKLYEETEILFDKVKSLGYKGITLKEYLELK